MRSMLTCLAFTAVILSAASAYAEKRTFVITNNIKGDPVHGCLDTPGGCGPSVVNAYCRDHGFKKAANYRKVERDEITGAVPSSGSAVGDELFAIDCTR